MFKHIEMIISDLNAIKSALPLDVMIGQLKISFCINESKEVQKPIRWRLNKRCHQEQTFYSIKYDESYCISEGMFIHGSIIEPSTSDVKVNKEEFERIGRLEIETFTQTANDHNIIHKGERPVVPGLLLLQKILWSMSQDDCAGITYQIKFLLPLFADDPFTIKKRDNIVYINNYREDCIATLTLEA